MSLKPYYEHAGITIYHGDCREVLPQLPAGMVGITDPPYGVDKQYGPSYDDDRDIYWEWFTPCLELMRAHLRPLVFSHKIHSIGRINGFDWVGVWSKTYSSASRVGNSSVFPHWEPIYMFGIHGQGVTENYRSDVYTYAPCGNGGTNGQMGRAIRQLDGAHPVPKPPEFICVLIKQFAKEQDLICDPFMGSSTTLRAAKDLGRRAIGIEIEEKYCEIAAERLSQEVLEFTP